ncbi:acyl-CoA Delta-9 desaturase-like isoform X5 [Diprion similis]|uniref:acyl-CoA Delta-9 desaturase-like isoform X5 n=1 Tax=Diprion similis TaxID=362088 RepID=UPI001EF8B516|nr:acyl-CoA Delta-9 desaturase-like isoform X5 [Diprion similis]
MLADETYTLEQSREKVFNESNHAEPIKSEKIGQNLVWKNIFLIVMFHVGFVFACTVYGFGLYAVRMKWLTVLWVPIVMYASGLGMTAGAHRLWSHRSYKANLTLRIILMILYSAAGLNPIFDWVKDHRVHHKYSETDADPHNAKRGFFFSHVGWLMVKRHPEYLRRQREVDLSDITADPVVMFNKKAINPRENSMVSLVTGGEGSHNYHHTFPWDYKASEWPYLRFNWTTLFIRGFSKIGWAYDLREPSPTLVKKVIQTIGHKSNVSSMVY